MAGRNRARRRLAAVLLLLSLPGCQSAPSRPTGGLDEGPTRWLMLPDEVRKYRHIHSTREAVDFNETFWRRRNPDPATHANEFAKAFYERVEAADRLYSEGGVRGSLTDRGRALILLGPPPVLRYGQKKVPAWDPGHPGAPSNVHTHEIVLETWEYPVAELPPPLAELIQADGPRQEIVLVFAVESRHTSLIEGEKYLDMAVRSAVRE
ncbi:MAG TPA: GWxTD domain-containing protein [Thermoanaerobaculia bacterium]|nr:GWxTD domain-containing protein [Thermoanaerobaculia bacterium]